MRVVVIGLMLPGCARFAGPALRQGHGIADPAFLEQYAVTRRFSLGHPTAIKIAPDGSAVFFLRSGPRSVVQDLYEFDTSTGQERVLLTAEGILKGAEEQLTVEELARRERMRMTSRGIASHDLSKDGTKILVPLSGRLFVITRADGRVTELPIGEGFPLDPRFSPDGTKVAFARDGELFVIDVPDAQPLTAHHSTLTARERQLTSGASQTLTHGLAEFVAQEEMDRSEGYWWSPDSRMLAYQQTDTSGMEVMHIADPMHPDRPPQTWPYPRPGKANARLRLGIIPAEGGQTTWVSWDQERYVYLATVRWKENSPLTILVQDRAQTEEVLLAVDPATGSTSTLLVETDPAWLNLDQQMPRWLKDGSGFLWTTERGGAWQLELRGRDGGLLGTLTPPELNYRALANVNELDRTVVITAGENPTQTHLFRASLDAEGTEGPRDPGTEGESRAMRFTEEPGIHGASFAEDHSVWVHTFSALAGGRRYEVMRADGTRIGELRSVAEEPPFRPNLELTTSGSSPHFHAAIVRPRNFASGRRYPVIVSVYGGPHSQTVTASRDRYLLHQWIADHGFIVVSLDGRGTPSRGRQWERAIRGDLIGPALADQESGLRALGGRYREMDLSRVGIYGWSFGGYFSAMAVMRRPEAFHVGVAGAPVSEWLDYDTHYTERYLGIPDQDAEVYRRSSVLTYADALKRPLLVIHGTADDNVYFLHSLKLSDALFRAGKPHDFLALSGFTHMVPDPLVTTRLYTRIMDYFQKHLRN